jgi:hypothetical protein
LAVAKGQKALCESIRRAAHSRGGNHNGIWTSESQQLILG